MYTNADCTVFNKVGQNYYKTVIKNVYWESSVGMKTVKSYSTRESDSKVLVIIPYSDDFILPKAFSRLDNKAGFFTLKNEDLIVKGIVTEEISADFTVTHLKKYYDDCYLITNVRNFDYGSYPHYEIDGA